MLSETTHWSRVRSKIMINIQSLKWVLPLSITSNWGKIVFEVNNKNIIQNHQYTKLAGCRYGKRTRV
jgi:hypothetical protein